MTQSEHMTENLSRIFPLLENVKSVNLQESDAKADLVQPSPKNSVSIRLWITVEKCLDRKLNLVEHVKNKIP